MNEVFSYLTHHQIEYLCHHHEAVFTCEDAEKLTHDIPWLWAKNLFLRNKKKDRVFLVILGSDTKADLKKFGEIVGEKKLSFGSPELLMETLKITPWSVSVFCLIHDPNARVEVFIDQKMYEAPIVNFHPNDNTASLEITNEMFHKYLKTLPHQIEVVDL